MSDLNVFSLTGKNVLITGGGSGLGLAMARCMTKAGARVVVINRDAQKARAAVAELGGETDWRSFDVSDAHAAQAFIDGVIGDFGRIDVLINNAGNHCKKPIEQMTIEDFESVLDVHVVGSFALAKAVVPYMKQQGSGSILFTASMTSFLGQPNVTGYAAAKSAFLGLIHGMATELSPAGIRVNGIAPGWIDTPMLRKAIEGDDERKNKILGRTPMKKFGEPDDIGWAATYLASDAAKFVNGHVLIVDGGALIGF